MRARNALIVLLLAAAGLVHASPAHAAQPVTCGAHLTEDAYLTGDLRCSAEDRIRVDAGVTLDLRGHRLVGAVVTIAGDGGGAAVVRNGVVEGVGVNVSGDPDARAAARVEDVRFVGGGISGFYSDLTVERSSFRGGYGGVTGLSSEVIISDSTFSGHQQSISAAQGTLTVTRSALRDSRTAIKCSEATCITTGSRIEGNGYGVFGWQASVQWRDNVVSDNDVAYHSAGNGGSAGAPYVDLLEGNRLVGNGVAVQLGDGTSVAVRNNEFRRNRTGIAARGYEGEFDYTALIEGNRLTRNGDAILLEGGGEEDVSASVRGNRVVRNTGWGIHAPGAIDLGGNVAWGNGKQPQCVGVVCSQG